MYQSVRENWTSWLLIGFIACPETSVTNSQSTLHNMLEEWRSRKFGCCYHFRNIRDVKETHNFLNKSHHLRMFAPVIPLWLLRMLVLLETATFLAQKLFVVFHSAVCKILGKMTLSSPKTSVKSLFLNSYRAFSCSLNFFLLHDPLFWIQPLNFPSTLRSTLCLFILTRDSWSRWPSKNLFHALFQSPFFSSTVSSSYIKHLCKHLF
jgi:hypothetical protein